MDTDSFIIHIKTKDFYKYIANGVEKWFDTTNYECDRPLAKRKNKKEIGKMKDELRGKIMAKFAAPRTKTYSDSMDDDSEAKKAKGTKKCVIKSILEFNDYKNPERFKSEAHNAHTEEVNKIALSNNDDKRLQT